MPRIPVCGTVCFGGFSSHKTVCVSFTKSVRGSVKPGLGLKVVARQGIGRRSPFSLEMAYPDAIGKFGRRSGGISSSRFPDDYAAGGVRTPMGDSTILVISDDSTLIGPVVDMVRSIDGLDTAILPGLERAHDYDSASWDRVALVMIHLTSGGPESEVVRLLRMISEARRPVATLVVADHHKPEQALTLLRHGVAEYLGRPLDLSRLSHLTEVLTIRSRGTDPGQSPETTHRTGTESTQLGLDESAEEDVPLMDQVRRVAPLHATILLGGETGTGKTRLAQRIHALSPRRAEPFVVINCGSLTSSQLEEEIFGQSRGPGRDRPSKLSEAGWGTLFLDEIDALPLSVQAKLLRVVEDRAFEAPGTGQKTPIQARLIAASSQDLEQEVAAHRFRSDLYYRLNVIGLRVTPLRERRGSILPLVKRFIAESPGGPGARVETISPPALRALEDYGWPGNVRELKNTIDRAVALAPGPEIGLGDLPETITRREPLSSSRGGIFRPPLFSVEGGPSSTLAEIKRDAELARITEALHKHSNNRLRAASELGISRMTLYKKLYKYGLMQPGPSDRRGPD